MEATVVEPVAGAEVEETEIQETEIEETEVAPGVSLAATSSSRWRRLLAAGSSRDVDTDLGEDARARCITFLVGNAVELGAGAGSAGELGDASRPGTGIVVVLEDVASPASRARIDAALARARTGWRFRVGGDEAALGALRAILHEAGVLDEEIEFVLAPPGQSDAQVTVYCGHCHAKTRTTVAQAGGSASSAQPAELVPCGGCGITLTVYHHYSRRQGAYLGYFAGAEQSPTDQQPADQQPAEQRSAERRSVTRDRSELALA